jgi:hypothetical protein
MNFGDDHGEVEELELNNIFRGVEYELLARGWSSSRWWLSEEMLLVVTVLWVLLQSSTVRWWLAIRNSCPGGNRKTGSQFSFGYANFGWGLPSKTRIDSKSWYNNRLPGVDRGVFFHLQSYEWYLFRR